MAIRFLYKYYFVYSFLLIIVFFIIFALLIQKTCFPKQKKSAFSMKNQVIKINQYQSKCQYALQNHIYQLKVTFYLKFIMQKELKLLDRQLRSNGLTRIPDNTHKAQNSLFRALAMAVFYSHAYFPEVMREIKLTLIDNLNDKRLSAYPLIHESNVLKKYQSDPDLMLQFWNSPDLTCFHNDSLIGASAAFAKTICIYTLDKEEYLIETFISASKNLQQSKLRLAKVGKKYYAVLKSENKQLINYVRQDILEEIIYHALETKDKQEFQKDKQDLQKDKEKRENSKQKQQVKNSKQKQGKQSKEGQKKDDKQKKEKVNKEAQDSIVRQQREEQIHYPQYDQVVSKHFEPNTKKDNGIRGARRQHKKSHSESGDTASPSASLNFPELKEQQVQNNRNSSFPEVNNNFSQRNGLQRGNLERNSDFAQTSNNYVHSTKPGTVEIGRQSLPNRPQNKMLDFLDEQVFDINNVKQGYCLQTNYVDMPGYYAGYSYPSFMVQEQSYPYHQQTQPQQYMQQTSYHQQAPYLQQAQSHSYMQQGHSYQQQIPYQQSHLTGPVNNQRYSGRLKFFDQAGNYGFIVIDTLNIDLFVHFDDLSRAGLSKDTLLGTKNNYEMRFEFTYHEYQGKQHRKSKKAVDLQLLPNE